MNPTQTGKFAPVFLLHAFQTGILAPVLSLFFLSKGILVNQLAILMGIYAVTVLVLEVPTGVLADLFGRKRTFLLSVLISSLSILIFIFSTNIYHIAFGIILYGLSRALSSGSLEALFIDRILSAEGKDGLAAASAKLNIFESLGLTSGAVVGGFLPTLCKKIPFFLTPYDMNLILRLAVTITVGILTQILIADIVVRPKEKSGRNLLKNHIKLSAELVRKETKLILLFLSVFASGIFFFSVETYWQPQFITILPDESQLWILGIVSFSYFVAALGGTLVSKKLLKAKKISANVLYPAGRLLLAASLGVLAVQSHIPGFIVFFALVYFFLGIANTPESVLMNELIPSRYRASILSLNSFILQAGALGTSLFSARFLIKGEISSLWIAASLILGTASILFIFLLKKKPRIRTGTPEIEKTKSMDSYPTLGSPEE